MRTNLTIYFYFLFVICLLLYCNNGLVFKQCLGKWKFMWICIIERNIVSDLPLNKCLYYGRTNMQNIHCGNFIVFVFDSVKLFVHFANNFLRVRVWEWRTCRICSFPVAEQEVTFPGLWLLSSVLISWFVHDHRETAGEITGLRNPQDLQLNVCHFYMVGNRKPLSCYYVFIKVNKGKWHGV